MKLAKSSLRPGAVLAALLLVAAACGGDAEESSATTATTAATAEPADEAADGLSGSIEVSGSSTVEPITALVAEKFNAANPGVGISVEGPGTGDGFQRFCAGETDISDASRAIKDSEAQACAEAGVEWVELKVAFDGISVLTSPENDAVSCLDLGDLYALVGAESEGFQSWSDANGLASELAAAGLGGSHAPYPDAPLVITAPGEESGTFDAFVELALEDITEERGQEEPTRVDYQASANDNVIVDNISSNPTSFGWVGFAFFVENSSVVKAIEVDGGDGCVAPSIGSIADGSYPLSRPLFIYVSLNRMADNPALGPFVDFYLGDGFSSVAEAGYVTLPDDEIAATMSAWASGAPSTATTAATSEPADEAADGLSGSIEVSGSSTVEPITALVAEKFNAANPGVGISVEGPGTGDGFQRFCAGETDISDASRAIKDSEAQACAEAGVEWVELKVAFDGISVLTSPENDAVSCLDLGDLYALVGAESEGFQSWSDANGLASELAAAGLGGSHAPYPDAPLVITAPGEESGTFDAFVELALEDITEERGQEEPTRVDYQASANDNVIVDNISSNPTSFGWVGFAFFVENSSVVKAIEVDGGDGCVAPSIGSIADGSYPLSRPLFIYVSLNRMADNPALGPFVDFYLGDGFSSVAEAGYVTLPDDEIAATMSAWASGG